MSARKQHYGKCFLCGKSMTKGALTRHLKKHIAEYAPEEAADLIWLRVEDQHLPRYFWLDLEMPTATPLDFLDDFLRAIWLECCGHLSHFILGLGRKRIYYERVPIGETFFWAEEYDMAEATVGEIADQAQKFEHEYDYGSTTALIVKVMSRHRGPKPPSPGWPVRILGRNYKPVVPCVVCGAPATHWDISTGEFNAYCDAHTDHVEEEEFLLPIVNSPRSGVCAYTGTSEPELTFEEVYIPQKG